MAATQILAAAITIAFEGLMLFQGPTTTEKTHVAVVDAHHHTPYVQIFDIDGKELTPRIDLNKGDEVAIGAAGVGHTDYFFEKYAIRLKDHVAFGSVDQDVVLRNVNHSGTLARVDLPDGNLTILATFKYPVRLDSWLTLPSTHCFPRYVVLTSKPATWPVKMTITGHPIPYEIPDDAIVIVSNGGPAGSTHFHEYRKMLGTLAFLESATLLNSPPCYGNTPQPIPSTLDPKVVNFLLGAARLPAVPNGDCGPVNNP